MNIIIIKIEQSLTSKLNILNSITANYSLNKCITGSREKIDREIRDLKKRFMMSSGNNIYFKSD